MPVSAAPAANPDARVARHACLDRRSCQTARIEILWPRIDQSRKHLHCPPGGGAPHRVRYGQEILIASAAAGPRIRSPERYGTDRPGIGGIAGPKNAASPILPILAALERIPVLAPDRPLWQEPPACRGPLGRFLLPRACCRSSVVEHSIGNGEVDSSILSGSTIQRADYLTFFVFYSLRLQRKIGMEPPRNRARAIWRLAAAMINRAVRLNGRERPAANDREQFTVRQHFHLNIAALNWDR